MRVDRSYLPYKSAREYQDRKMAKWLGFFLSEHMAAMQYKDTQNRPVPLEEETKLLRIQQAWQQQAWVDILVDEGTKVRRLTGRIDNFQKGQVGITSPEGYVFLDFKAIFTVTLAEEAPGSSC